jgi:hypothetical protein
MVSFKYEVSLLIFVLMTFIWVIVRYWHFLLSLCWGLSGSVSLMKLSTQTLGTYKLTVVISSWFIVSFVSMVWSFLYPLANLKSTLTDVSIATRAWFRGYILEKSFFIFSTQANVYFCWWDAFLISTLSSDLALNSDH